jgi:cytochrome c oxidase cbb3-type subunit 3
VAYVRSLSNPNDADYFAARGKQHYDGLCAACHGPEGRGDATLGAPDLADDNWLYGGSSAALRTSITEGRHGVMPAHRELLGETRARLVAAYVWSLSNGSGDAAGAGGAAAGTDAAR